jgi:hypothetical protein
MGGKKDPAKKYDDISSDDPVYFFFDLTKSDANDDESDFDAPHLPAQTSPPTNGRSPKHGAGLKL